MSQDQFAACEQIVRKADYDRYLTALFAPADQRRHLFALYAFNYETGKTAETVTQPMAGLIRLQWWRDSIDEIYGGEVRSHAVAQALAETVHAHHLPRTLFDTLLNARESDLEETPFARFDQLDTYADAVSGNLMRLAARIAGAGDGLDTAAGHAGIAYALSGLLRALPYHVARRHLTLPAAALASAHVSPESVFSGETSAGLTAVVAQTAERARAHLAAARSSKIPAKFLPALLPAALVPNYLRVVARRGFNIFRDSTEVPVYRRQLALMRAMLRRSI